LIEKGDKPVGSLLPEDFDPSRIRIMVKEGYRFTDQRDRSFVETAIEGDGPVFLHLPKDSLSEEILQVGRGWPQTLQVRGEALHGCLTRHRMEILVIALKPD